MWRWYSWRIMYKWLWLAAGYLNQPELTADKFIKDSNINQLMYRSGDIVRLLPMAT